MKQKILFLAALALIAASCTKTEVEIAAAPKAGVITLTASIPADDPETRISFETTQATPHGLRLKWEPTDKLMLNFKQGDTFYPVDAPIDAKSISADGKTARFTLALPQEMSAGQTFDLYGVYQKTVPPIKIEEEDELYDEAGYIEAGTNNYVLENNEELCITLNKTNATGNMGIIRPVLWFKQTNVANTADIALDLRHLGWIMAVHLYNDSEEAINLPVNIFFQYDLSDEAAPVWNSQSGGNNVIFNMTEGTLSNESPMDAIYFNINRHDWALYQGTVEPGESIVLYRWLVNDENAPAPELKPTIETENANGQQVQNELSTSLPSRQVERGKVYHVHIVWNGTDFELSKPNP